MDEPPERWRQSSLMWVQTLGYPRVYMSHTLVVVEQLRGPSQPPKRTSFPPLPAAQWCEVGGRVFHVWGRTFN